MGKQRIIYLDLAKFLAITLVCVGHAYYFGDEMQSKVRPISSIAMLAIPYGGSLMINYYLLFFWTGYFLRKHYQWYDKYTKLITYLSLIVFTLLILLGKGQAVDKVTLQTIISMPTYIVMEYIVGLAGSMLCFCLLYTSPSPRDCS